VPAISPLLLTGNLPGPGARRVSVRLTKDAQRQVRGRHPWVYDASITSVSHNGASGDLAVLFDDKRQFLAIGLYDPASPIRVRVLHQGQPLPIDDAFWAQRIAAALQRRDHLARSADTNAYRCIHGENDQLPGLVLDRYDRSYVLKLDTTAWLPHLLSVLSALAEQLEPKRVLVRFSRRARVGAVAFGLVDGSALLGSVPAQPVQFSENGLTFEADLVRGQKTGHFLDQRDNRARVGRRAEGAHLLDVFSCSGGFTVNAAAGGAASVHSIDSSSHAITAVARNLELNRDRAPVAGCRANATVGDAFAVMADLVSRGRRFDLVVVDPPSFATKQADVARALAAYRRLTRLAVALVRSGGVLVQSSCSGRVPSEQFFAAVNDSAIAQGAGVDRPRR
jgi:23S rRNA (cytosine1962-C5)-methyltransferase